MAVWSWYGNGGVVMVWRWCCDGVAMVWRWCGCGVDMVWLWCGYGGVVMVWRLRWSWYGDVGVARLAWLGWCDEGGVSRVVLLKLRVYGVAKVWRRCGGCVVAEGFDMDVWCR